MDKEEEIEKLTEMQAQLNNIADTQNKLVEKLDTFTDEYMADKADFAVRKAKYEIDKKDIVNEKERFIKDIKELKERVSKLEYKSVEKDAGVWSKIKGKGGDVVIQIVVFLIGTGLVAWLLSLIGG